MVFRNDCRRSGSSWPRDSDSAWEVHPRFLPTTLPFWGAGSGSFRASVAIRWARSAWLGAGGVDVSKVRKVPGTTTGLTVILPRPGARNILTYPGAMFEMCLEDL